MPSKSKKQHNLMMAVAHSPEFAKKVGIKQSVGKDYAAADKGKKFGTGGDVNYSYGGNNQINKQRTRFGSKFGYKLNAPDENLTKYIGKKEGGTVDKKDLAQDKKIVKKAVAMHDKQMHGGKKTDMSKLKKGGATKCCGGGKIKKMASGGLAAGHKSADGIATKGKTRGIEVKMKKGGKC